MTNWHIIGEKRRDTSCRVCKALFNTRSTLLTPKQYAPMPQTCMCVWVLLCISSSFGGAKAEKAQFRKRPWISLLVRDMLTPQQAMPWGSKEWDSRPTREMKALILIKEGWDIRVGLAGHRRSEIGSKYDQNTYYEILRKLKKIHLKIVPEDRAWVHFQEADLVSMWSLLHVGNRGSRTHVTSVHGRSYPLGRTWGSTVFDLESGCLRSLAAEPTCLSECPQISLLMCLRGLMLSYQF